MCYILILHISNLIKINFRVCCKDVFFFFTTASLCAMFEFLKYYFKYLPAVEQGVKINKKTYE